ncbi:MAG: ring-1,2-phenylacetyl-CoA epoxidase subunit PaaE [Crocinitomicaceae bacterium]|jgi:ring-1,2-phenylacetyl-CoA epoxidase subunit PaaE
MKPTFHSLVANDIINETEDTVSIAFDVPSELSDDYKFKSGQYLTLRADINNEDTRRSYSLCSSPFENELRVAVKQVPNGKFSTYANNDLKVGMSVDVMTPSGNFALTTDSNNSKSYVLFAAGSGVTPIFSIAKSALHEEPNSDVTLFYGNKGFASIIFREEIEALKNQYMDRLRVVHVLSRESLGNPLQKGRIDKEKADKLFDGLLKGVDIDAVYVCGPEQMIHAVKDSMTEKGVDASKIHFELFTTPSTEKKIELPTNAPKIDANVIVIIDDEEIELNLSSDGMNILDAAQAAGGDVPYACKGGVCCTCKAKIIEGTARMDVNYALEPDEVAEGFILTCQAHPTSDKLIVSFDE